MRLKVIYTTILAILFAAACRQQVNGQDQEKVPLAVRVTFQNMYPGENDPDWHIDAHGSWESRFRIDGIRHRADYQPDGTWIETEVSIDVDELPEAVLKVLKAKYSKEVITEVERVDNALKGAFFDVEFKRKGKNKDVEFRASGEIIN